MKFNNIPQLQFSRYVTKSAFFLLFLFAPILDIFRFDLTLGHFIIFGQPWTLNVEVFLAGEGDALDAAIRIFTRVFLPFVGFIGVTGWLIWRYGRIYCGWLCPHFSVVEWINGMMLRQLSRVTLWEKATRASRGIAPKFIIFIAALSMAFIWALGLLGYLLPPKQLLLDLVNFELGFGARLFIIVTTTVFTLDFIFARHLFCKYGCALGLFQSLIWMANRKALVIKFDRSRAKACRDCSVGQTDKACDLACPMRLPTRNMKRAKFTCTQCLQCVSACNQVQQSNPNGGLLNWVDGQEAIEVDRKSEIRAENSINIKEIK